MEDTQQLGEVCGAEESIVVVGAVVVVVVIAAAHATAHDLLLDPHGTS